MGVEPTPCWIVRVLLDEDLPVGLAGELSGRSVEAVTGLGRSGVRNGELLRRAADRFDALVTMDSNPEFQQALSGRPFGVVVVRAASNRVRDLLPVVPKILAALGAVYPVEVRTAGSWIPGDVGWSGRRPGPSSDPPAWRRPVPTACRDWPGSRRSRGPRSGEPVGRSR
jgi:hypothetical protein